MTTSSPSSLIADRAAGALLGLAAGDALGAGYEGTMPASDDAIDMIGGGLGGFEPGEWTDDTAQAVAIARVTADGQVDLSAIGEGFLSWYAQGPADVGISTSAVLRGAQGDPERLSAVAARYFARRPGGAAGNGALMRTAAVALANLGDDDAIRADAMAVAALTHGDPLAGEGCVLWCVAIDRAVREGRLDGVWDGLELLPEASRDRWAQALRAAEDEGVALPRRNGFVVTALQAAYGAIVRTPVPADHPARHLTAALEAAVRVGGDTDTVAAIAGQLLGARWGASAVPARWQAQLHGWPGIRSADLVRLAVRTARRGRDDGDGWPAASHMLAPNAPVCAPHPADPDLLLGNLGGIEAAVRAGATTVVSLCRTGGDDVPRDVEHVTVWLIDSAGQDENPHLELVLTDVVDFIVERRAAGERVFVHCAAAGSRTPTVAALYTQRVAGGSARGHVEALRSAIPVAMHNDRFLRHLESAAEPRTLARPKPAPAAGPRAQPSLDLTSPSAPPSFSEDEVKEAWAMLEAQGQMEGTTWRGEDLTAAARRRLDDPDGDAMTTPDPVVTAAAAAFAIQKHDDQVRKDTTIPYWTHLAAVAGLVAQYGGTDEQVVAGWLHDVVEDCGGLPVLDEIRAGFGDAVADMVEELSDSTVEDRDDKLPWRERKEDYIAKLRAHPGAPSVLVSLADKLHNAESIVADLDDPLVGRTVFRRFSASAEDTAWMYGELLSAFSNDPSLPVEMVDRFQRAVDKIQGAVAAPTSA